MTDREIVFGDEAGALSPRQAGQELRSGRSAGLPRLADTGPGELESSQTASAAGDTIIVENLLRGFDFMGFDFHRAAGFSDALQGACRVCK